MLAELLNQLLQGDKSKVFFMILVIRIEIDAEL